MNMSFRVSPLSGTLVRQALPLIQITWPGVGLPAWRSFVAAFSPPPPAGDGGALALHDPSGQLCGALVYRLERDLCAGAVLSVRLFTAVDLINSLRTVRALLHAAEVKAYEHGCEDIQIHLYEEQAGLAARLRRLGLAAQNRILSMSVDRTQAPH